MPHDFDIPMVAAGDPIKATDWNKLVRALRPRIEPGGYQSDAFNIARPTSKRQKRKPGKNSTLPTGRFAKVVGGDVAADGNGYAVWLNDQLEFEWDDFDSETEGIEGSKFEFRNAQAHTGIKDGARIALFGSKPVTAGSEAADTGCAGFAVDVADQLATVSGDGALVGGYGSTSLSWDKTECPPP